MRILVVEDEKPLRENIAEALCFEGFDIFEATDGLDGVHQALREQPDLIICDIAMPEMDGYQVLTELRNHPKTKLVPFIFLTARAERAFMRHGMELGADDYLTKPFTNAELVAAVRTRLSRQELVAQAASSDLEAAKKQLAYTVTHELRTPLVSVMMVQDLITRQLDHLSSQEIRELLKILGSGSQRLNHLVEQMVLMIQLETGLLSSDVIRDRGAAMAAPDLIEASIKLARRFAYRRREGMLRLELAEHKTSVRCHRQSLTHAVAELITNALDFSPDDNEVIVSHWAEDGTVWITIVDHGVGISPQNVTRAMRFFEQINRETQEQQGMGLGLPLARQIIEAHGGSLRINSIAGKGTKAVISLPAS